MKIPKGLQPFRRRTMGIKLPLLGFGGFADTVLGRRIGHRHEPPGLLVRTTGRAPSRTQAMLDHFARDWGGCVIAHCTAATQFVSECLRTNHAFAVG